jgi:hypothetical protein
MAGTAGILGTWPQVKALSRNAWVWAGTAAIGLSCAFAVYWIARHDSLSSDPFEAAGSSPLSAAVIMLDRTLLYSTGYVGQFGWLEVPAPTGAFVLWLGLAAMLVLATVVLARGRGRIATIFLFAALLLLPPLLQAQAVGTMGIVWQGRYILAVFVPLLLVCGVALDRMDARGFSPRLRRSCMPRRSSLRSSTSGHSCRPCSATRPAGRRTAAGLTCSPPRHGSRPAARCFASPDSVFSWCWHSGCCAALSVRKAARKASRPEVSWAERRRRAGAMAWP